MVEANVKIIEELKLFLEETAGDRELRKLIVKREQDFSRDRKLPLKRLVGLLISLPKRSLSIEIQEFFERLGEGVEHCSNSALSLQRGKLDALLFKVWNKWLVDHFYYYYGDRVKRWRSFVVQAVDGSTAYLLNKPEVVHYFGTQDNQHVAIPMARILQVHDVLNDLSVWGDLFPITQSEPSILANEVPHLGQDSLTLFDRAYPSYALRYRLLKEAVEQLLRSRKRSKSVILTPNHKAIATLREHGYIVTAPPL